MTRYPLILAVVGGALALAACGGNSNNGGAAAASGDDRAFEGAVKFSRCMREHGVEFPDPKREAGGGISIGGPGAARVKNGSPDPKLRIAERACRKYLEVGGRGEPMDPAQQARFQDAFYAYARCMRGKGIDMPDPKVTSHGVQMRVEEAPGGPRNGGPKGAPVESPRFKAADAACHHFLGEIDKLKGGGPKNQSSGPSTESSK